MADLRIALSVMLAVLVTACSAPSPRQQSNDAALAGAAPLRTQYAGVVAGLDTRPPATLIVSVDLQRYIEMDDDAVAAMQRHALALWRSAWTRAHPHARALVRVRFIDFIGRKVAELTTAVR